MTTGNSEVLADFVAYCEANPSMRFWQALRNWSEENFIMASSDKQKDFRDTFYWETRTGRK